MVWSASAFVLMPNSHQKHSFRIGITGSLYTKLWSDRSDNEGLLDDDNKEDLVASIPDKMNLLENKETTEQVQKSDNPSKSNKSSILQDETILLPIADLDSLSSNLSYFYLKNEIGLSEDVMWKITCDAGSVLRMTAAKIRHKVDVLRGLLDLSDDNIRTIIERQPSVLQLSPEKNISPTILHLLRYLDLGRDDLRALIVSCPAILTYSKANLRTKIRFFKQLMGFSSAECRSLFIKEPKLVKAGVHTGLFPRLRFFLRDMQMSLDDLRYITLRHPMILLYSLENNLVPKLVNYCLLTIRLEPTQVTRLLRSYPEFMSYNLERTIVPITQYFLHDLDFSTPEFQKILLSYPRLVSNSLIKIKHVVGFLRYETGLCATQVRRVLHQAPSIIGLNTDISLRNKVEYIRDFLYLNDDDWKRLLAGMPNILLLSIELNLMPKLEFLLEAFENDVDTLRETILRLPALLGYSLDKRIIPRMDAIKKAGTDNPGSITVGIPMKEEQFCTWLQGRKEAMSQTQGDLHQSDGTSANPANRTGPKNKGGRDDTSGRIVHWTRERRRRK